MRAAVGFSFLPFLNPKMVYFYPPILPIVYTQVWLQLISNLMWCIFSEIPHFQSLFPVIACKSAKMAAKHLQGVP